MIFIMASWPSFTLKDLYLAHVNAAGQAPYDNDRKDLGKAFKQPEGCPWREHLDKCGQADDS